MKFNQKKWGNKSGFDLRETDFTYVFEDDSTETSLKHKYIDLPSEDECFNHADKNILFLFLSISFFVGGFIQYLFYQFWKGEVRLSLVTIGLVLVIMSRTTRTRYSVLPTDKGNVLVIKNKQHDEIITELYERRKQSFLKLYGGIDENNDCDYEIKKFDWLFEQGVIDENELAEFKTKVQLIHNNDIVENSNLH
jgi:hypothetical protein